MQKPIATTSQSVNDYIDKMKDNLRGLDFGKVGIVFTVHENQVVGIQEIRETKWIKNGEK